METKHFSITRVEVPFTIDGVAHVLREADEGAAVKYRNAQMIGMTLGPDGKPIKIAGIADSEPLLVSLCAFRVDNGTIPVSLETVLSWPPRVVKWLHDKAKEISDLNEEDTLQTLVEQRNLLEEKIAKAQQKEDSAKNLLVATPTTSV